MTVICPAGKKVVGTGAELFGATGQAVIDEIIPSPSLSSVSAAAYEDGDGYADDWQMIVYAICANVAP